MTKGILVILSGPSGAGKDTVIQAWAEANPRVQRVITCTTRAPREGEVNGVHYHFLTPKQFEESMKRGELLEQESVYTETMYGTPREGVERLLDAGRIAVLNVDVNGAKAIKQLYPNAVTVFILPPSMEELKRRLLMRNPNADPNRVAERLRRAEMEISEADWYEHQIVNDQVDAAVAQLEEIVR
ncbi:MAG: guanylate kinase [Armatimonadota bacterium]